MTDVMVTKEFDGKFLSGDDAKNLQEYQDMLKVTTEFGMDMGEVEKTYHLLRNQMQFAKARYMLARDMYEDLKEQFAEAMPDEDTNELGGLKVTITKAGVH